MMTLSKNKFSVNKNNWLLWDNKRINPVSCAYNKYSSSRNICDYIVMHYTGATTVSSAHNTYKTQGRNVSWHLTIGRDGRIYQLLDFRRVAWHAGRSTWWRKNGDTIKGLNRWSIGIEMISAGKLELKNGGYYTWFNKRIPQEEVFLDETGQAWQNFTMAQKKSVRELMPALISKYKIVDILTHEEISPGRKVDPGPAADSLMKDLKDLIE